MPSNPFAADEFVEQGLLRQLFDAMPQLGWTARPDGFIDYYNRGWYEFTGTTYDEMKGWGWQSVHHPDEIARVMVSWQRSIATARPWELEFPLRRADGVYRWFLSRATPIFDDNNRLIRWVGINTDIDDQKKAERQLAELDHAKSLFFSNVSHELRTPLTLILAPLEQALQDEQGTLSRSALELTHRNARRLLKLVNMLLDFSRAEAGPARAVFRPTDVAALTRELASAFESAAQVARLTLVVECEPSTDLVYVDRDLWEKLVFNLISNALKFTARGEIRVGVRRVAETVELRVSDTGHGIHEDELARVFERFHRVAGAQGRSIEGSGIGLALVQEIAALHGGRAEAESTVGVGSSFVVRLPLGHAHLPAARISREPLSVSNAPNAAVYLDEVAQWQPPSPVTPSAPSARSLAPEQRILIVDDNADMRQLLTHLLAPRWLVETAADGAQALAAARSNRPHLVLTDVMMPTMDGFALIRAMRSDPSLQSVPIIVLSARAGEDARIGGLETGADDYLVKPFSGRELVARVAAQLQIAELRSAAIVERDKLLHLFDRSPVTVSLHTGPEHRFEFVNTAYMMMVGRKEYVGLPIRHVFPELPADHPLLKALDAAFESGNRVDMHEMLPLSAGGSAPDDRWFNYVIQPVGEAQGVRKGLMVMAIEVTEQVQARRVAECARRDAEQSRMLLATAQRSANIGVFDWHPSIGQLYWSPELFALLGLDPTTSTASIERWNSRILPEDAERGWKDFEAACAAHRETHQTEQRVMLPNGSTRWVRISNHIAFDESGKPARVIGTVIDVQNLKELVERERLTRLAAEKASMAKDEFLAILGHELRNPLSPILGALQLIKARGGKDLAREISVMERQSEHLVRLVDDLLDVSRVTSGKVTLRREHLELREIVAAALEIASPLITEAKHDLRVNVPEHGLAVEVDRVRMTQVFANLLMNAAKYTPPKGRMVVSAERQGDDVVASVRDNGTGLSPELLPNVFDLFVQARQTLDRSQGGLGLGLAIVKSLVSLHGGSVSAESAGVGHGSNFEVRLPVAMSSATRPSAPPSAPRPSMHGGRILVVDDNQDSAEMLAELLNTLGYQTAVANDPTSALALADDYKPDLALLDIGLPGMDGYELAERLRLRLREVRMVAVTGYGQESDRQRAREAGFIAHLTKPLDFTKLTELLREMLDTPPGSR